MMSSMVAFGSGYVKLKILKNAAVMTFCDVANDTQNYLSARHSYVPFSRAVMYINSIRVS